MSITKITRKKAYEEIKETAISRRVAVKTFLLDYKEGLTANEIAKGMQKEGIIHGSDRNLVHPRLNELVKQGDVFVDGRKTCSVSGKTCAIYKAIIKVKVNTQEKTLFDY